MISRLLIGITSVIILALYALSPSGVNSHAADQQNPKDCHDPWECYEKAKLEGTISGPNEVCMGVASTWKLKEKFTPGTKTRCELTETINKKSSKWTWNYVGGPEASDGENEGTSFTATFNQIGDYTIKWEGSGTLDDEDTCGYLEGTTAEFKFSVIAADRQFLVWDGPTYEPGGSCVGDVGALKFTLLEHSPNCWDGPYTVNWKLESNGNPTLEFTPSSGTVTFNSPDEEQKVQVSAKLAADSVSGLAKFTVTATSDYGTETGDGSYQVVVPPQKASATIASSSGCPGDPLSIDFEVKNTGECKGKFGWEVTTATPGVSVVGQGNPPVEIAAGGSHKGVAKFKIDPNIFTGKNIFYKITAKDKDGNQLGSGEGQYVIEPQPKLTAKTSSIVAGGINPNTDATDIELSMICGGGNDTITISLIGGLGSTKSESYNYLVGDKSFPIGGDRPARLQYGFKTIAAGSGETISVEMTSGSKRRLRLFSSNKIGDSAQIRATSSSGATATVSVKFISPTFEIKYEDGEGTKLDNALPMGQNLVAKCKLSYSKNTPVTGHEVAFYCVRYTDSTGRVIHVNKDSDPNISSSELAKINRIVSINEFHPTKTTDNQGMAEFNFVVLVFGIKKMEFELRDMNTFSPNSN